MTRYIIHTLIFFGFITATVSAQTTTSFLTLGEGNTTGDGTFIGVTSYSTQPCYTKSFALEHHFFGSINSSINFFRGGSVTGGFLTFNTNDNSERMRIDQNGNVGIGTTSPNTKLDINGSTLIHGSGTYYNNAGAADLHVGYGLATPCTSGAVTRLALQPYAHTGGPWNFISRDDAVNAWLDIKYGTTLGITLKNDGYIGIGTTTPDEKLTVNGVIHAKEVKVDLNGPLADFVFKPNYKLMSLTQVEQFVKANNHLPQMPSANEVAKNGLSMGEMQNKLLQKVEELSLYAIQENNTKKELERKYNALLEKVEMLTKQIEKK